MPYTVNPSFDIFRSKFVDLDPDDVEKARNSRYYLENQIDRFPSLDNEFPSLYGSYQNFGSFSRRTKIRKLDDIDILLLLNGSDISTTYSSFNVYKLYILNKSNPLCLYNDKYSYLNSTRVLNKLKNSLLNVPNYQKAEIKRTGVAVALNLKSYDWTFDIVPAFPVGDNLGRTSYYYIPDGKGNWMRTDPRKDQTFITEANQYHKNNLIPLIRLIKYWNINHYSTSKLPSYYLETMLINGLILQNVITNIKNAIPMAFQVLATQVMSSCPDPKGLGDNLDARITWETKIKVNDAANNMVKYSQYALNFEKEGKHKEAISCWQYIFPQFPEYGS